MKPDPKGMIAVANGLLENRDYLEKLRVEKIRNSSILVDGPLLDDAYESAKFLRSKKPMTGLIRMREILTKMNR